MRMVIIALKLYVKKNSTLELAFATLNLYGDDNVLCNESLFYLKILQTAAKLYA